MSPELSMTQGKMPQVSFGFMVKKKKKTAIHVISIGIIIFALVSLSQHLSKLYDTSKVVQEN